MYRNIISPFIRPKMLLLLCLGFIINLIILSAIISYDSINSNTVYAINKAEAKYHYRMYPLTENRYIQWLPLNEDKDTVKGYIIWEENERATEKKYSVIEKTYIFNPISLSYVIEKSLLKDVHHIAPLMLFIEENKAHSTETVYYDVVANEALPELLFEELQAFHHNYLKKIEPAPWKQQADPDGYLFRTENYFATFMTTSVVVENQDVLKVIDPISPEQYSLVYAP